MAELALVGPERGAHGERGGPREGGRVVRGADGVVRVEEGGDLQGGAAARGGADQVQEGDGDGGGGGRAEGEGEEEAKSVEGKGEHGKGVAAASGYTKFERRMGRSVVGRRALPRPVARSGGRAPRSAYVRTLSVLLFWT